MPPAFILSQDQTLHDSCFGFKKRSKVELSQPIEVDSLTAFKRTLRIQVLPCSVHPSASFLWNHFLTQNSIKSLIRYFWEGFKLKEFDWVRYLGTYRYCWLGFEERNTNSLSWRPIFSRFYPLSHYPFPHRLFSVLWRYGGIAQLVEHLPYKQTVGGSSPSTPIQAETKLIK